MTAINRKNYSFLAVAALCSAFMFFIVTCRAQDYDDEGYGNQGGGNNNNQGGDNDNYGASYGNDDSYNGNMPNYQQNVDSDGSNNNPSNSYPSNQGGGNSDADGDYEGDDGTAAAAASAVNPTIVKRLKRSILNDVDNNKNFQASSEPKLRVKRHGKYYIGPVYTYVKTDKHANFKWGVKHKVGKKHHG